jgi:3-hydroxyisobutyrate dehydrogenase
MGLATQIGSLTGSPLPLAGAAEHIYGNVVQECPDLARKDFSSVYKYLEQAAENGKKISVA